MIVYLFSLMRQDAGSQDEACRKLNQLPNSPLEGPVAHHLCQQVLTAALDVLAHAALLGLLVVARLAVADGHLGLIGGRGVLVADGALGHAQLALEG